ncbi:MAG: hypothetical protein Q9192_007468, partial [Flavoplaca navasiana]
YSAGTSNTPFYNGAHFASSQDIILITLNFRLNIFGFPGFPRSTNLGLQDQRLAIRWIYTNIRAFGGSPDRIVIAGQSSGSVAVDYWTFAYTDDPIVAGYIQHSGNALSFGLNSRQVAEKHWYDVSKRLGCGGEGDTVGCMRAIGNVSAIEEAVGMVKPEETDDPARVAPTFQPTPDNITVFNNYKERYERGNFSRLPVLLGQTANEANWYKIPAYRTNTTLPASLWRSFETSSFTCPTSFAAHARSSFNIPTYRFIYHGDWPNLRLYGPSTGNGNERGSGAWHGSDVVMVLGNSVGVSGLEKSREEERMERVMGGVWGAFVRDPRDGLRGMGWERGGGWLARLGFGGRGGMEFVDAGVYDGVCGNVTVEG